MLTEDAERTRLVAGIQELEAEQRRLKAALSKRRHASIIESVLADASAQLALSLDFESTLASTARLLVPRLADWCVVQVMRVDEDHRGRRGAPRQDATAVAADSRRQQLLDELIARHPLDERSRGPAAQVLRSGKPYFVPDVGSDWPDRIAVGASQRRLIRTLEPKSLAVLPLPARGKTLGVLTLAYSESGRRYAEGDLALAQEFAHRAALALDNARLYGEAQRAVRTRDDFLAAVSHDLKNPLTAIKGQSQLMERQLARLDSPQVEQLSARAATITATAVSMTRLLDELVDVARLRIGHELEIDRAPTDLLALCHRAVAAAQSTTDEHRISFELAGDSAGDLVGLWDEARLERVLGNLLGNAIKYSPAGGDVTVRLRREVVRTGTWAVLEVQDPGLGISEREVPFIFDQFRRGEGATGRHIPGAGVGLSTAREIVEQHGGTIAVESQVGRGSTFTVRLPLDVKRRRRTARRAA